VYVLGNDQRLKIILILKVDICDVGDVDKI
jgi:hypothetical protein